MRQSRVLRKLRAGELVVAAGVNRVPQPWLAEVIGTTGQDVIWFDMEHRSVDFDQLDAFSLACRYRDIDLMVRVRKEGYTSPMRALEFGANGLMVPHVRSVEEARQWVEWTKFPPIGRRGFDGAGADADYGAINPHEYLEFANRETFLALQVEDPEAVECVDEVAALEGVDLLFVGLTDLSIGYGIPMELDHPKITAAVQRVADAAQKHGKWWGIPTSAESAPEMVKLGARMITAGDDHSLLMMGYRAAFQAVRDLRVG